MKHLRSKVPIKSAQIKGTKVEYFVGKYSESPMFYCTFDGFIVHMGRPKHRSLIEYLYIVPTVGVSGELIGMRI